MVCARARPDQSVTQTKFPFVTPVPGTHSVRLGVDSEPYNHPVPKKDQIGQFYGMLLHEAQYFDPVMRDFEAFIDSSQQRVSGDVRVQLHQGHALIVGVRSAYSMMNPQVGTYGEQNKMWSAEDAKGFCNLYGTQSILSALALHSAQNVIAPGQS